jgi:beta-glucosidase
VSSDFPADFWWGAATAAYQIEGSPLADGAGPSIWHRFSHTPGRVANGDTGDVACDHYRRLESDLDLMQSLGLKAYRFSISWSRLFPTGTGAFNPAGAAFYERLVDGLLKRGIEPCCTLYHWDLPAALDDRGGWTNPDIAHWFADYADAAFRLLDDRIQKWVTLNEPWVVADGGYLHGVLAPGHRSAFEAPRASHHLLRAHGAAVQAYRAVGRHEIGLVVNLEPKVAASDRPEDLEAVRRADAYMNRQYLDPVFKGGYPEALRDIYGEAWPEWPDADFRLIGERIDFLGINYYTRGLTRHDPTAWPVGAAHVKNPRATYTETGWEVCPSAFRDLLIKVKQDYGNVPLYITENGSAFYDPPVAVNGRVHDPLRRAYLESHLGAVGEAIRAGVDIRGYFVWSFLDNYEWALGYQKRFGIVHVDYGTQVRTIKDSGRYYRAVIAAGGRLDVEPE